MALLSNKIHEYRFRNDEMTQKVLAERVGVSRQTINAIENGRHPPTVAVAIRIAVVFRASVDQLFELNYDGKPARRQQESKVAIDRSQATIEEPVKLEGEHEPLEKAAERRTSLAALRGVI